MNTPVYRYGDKLYLNITNKCHLDCSFCIRKKLPGLGDAQSLWLEEEPTCQQVLDQVAALDYTQFAQIVFCGYGEPTERLHDLLAMAKGLKKLPQCPPLRLDTNGLASLMLGYDTTPEIAERFDEVSISLNAPTAAEYAALCPSQWGEQAFFAMLDFARAMRKQVRNTRLTLVDCLEPQQLQQAVELAQRLDIPLHIRPYRQE